MATGTPARNSLRLCGWSPFSPGDIKEADSFGNNVYCVPLFSSCLPLAAIIAGLSSSDSRVPLPALLITYGGQPCSILSGLCMGLWGYR